MTNAFVTENDVFNALLGTEDRGSLAKVYTVGLPVGRGDIGLNRAGNKSGLSFGVVQLEFGITVTRPYFTFIGYLLDRRVIIAA